MDCTGSGHEKQLQGLTLTTLTEASSRPQQDDAARSPALLCLVQIAVKRPSLQTLILEHLSKVKKAMQILLWILCFIRFSAQVKESCDSNILLLVNRVYDSLPWRLHDPSKSANERASCHLCIFGLIAGRIETRHFLLVPCLQLCLKISPCMHRQLLRLEPVRMVLPLQVS